MSFVASARVTFPDTLPFSVNSSPSSFTRLSKILRVPHNASKENSLTTDNPCNRFLNTLHLDAFDVTIRLHALAIVFWHDNTLES